MNGFSVSVFLLSLTVVSSMAQAKSLELKKNTRSIFIEEKKNWTLGRELFGMPFVYFSPQQNGQRSNISFTDTGADIELDFKSLSNTQDQFRENKKNWAKQMGANPLSFRPYELVSNKFGHKIHNVGFSYEHQGKVYFEQSYYIECRGKILFSKSLRLQENSSHEKDFKDLIQTLDCGGV